MPRKTLSNMNSPQDSSSNTGGLDDESVPTSRKKVRPQDDFLLAQSTMMQKAWQMLTEGEASRQTRERDSDDIFGELIADTMRPIPNGPTKELLRINIQALVLERKQTLLRYS